MKYSALANIESKIITHLYSHQTYQKNKKVTLIDGLSSLLAELFACVLARI